MILILRLYTNNLLLLYDETLQSYVGGCNFTVL